MEWIKRNLYFVIGATVAVVLMGLAGWYLYSKWEYNNSMLGQLDEQYTKLKELNSANPHWGSGEVDNIKAAKDERLQLREFIDKSRTYFQRIPPIPATDSGKVSSQEFSAALARTLDHLQHDASKANVNLPPKSTSGQNYSFSFEFQSQNVTFAAGSLEPLATQLGEVKVISDVLFDAKINSLDYLRRERISDDDLKGAAGDYVAEKSLTNDLAVLSPYEMSFKCFSAELASVLAGFAKSHYALLVKSVNVEKAPSVTTIDPSQAPAAAAALPVYVPPPPPPQADGPRGDDFNRRYPGMRGPVPVAPAPQQPQVYAAARPAANRGGLPTALDEKQLKVTMTVMVVKMMPAPAPAK